MGAAEFSLGYPDQCRGALRFVPVQPVYFVLFTSRPRFMSSLGNLTLVVENTTNRFVVEDDCKMDGHQQLARPSGRGLCFMCSKFKMTWSVGRCELGRVPVFGTSHSRGHMQQPLSAFHHEEAVFQSQAVSLPHNFWGVRPFTPQLPFFLLEGQFALFCASACPATPLTHVSLLRHFESTPGSIPRFVHHRRQRWTAA